MQKPKSYPRITTFFKYGLYLLPFRKKAAIISFLSLIGVALSLINPYLAKLMVDKAYGNRDLKLFIILIVFGGFIYLLDNILGGVKDYLSRSIKLRIEFDLNRKVFYKLQKLPYSFFQNHSSAEFLYNMTYDIEQAALLIVDFFPKILLFIPRLIFVLAIIFYLNKQMAFLCLLLSPFLLFLPRHFSLRLRNIFEIWINDSQKIFESLQEKLAHIQLIKAFGKERCAIRGYVKALAKNMRLRLDNSRLEVAGTFANSTVSRLALGFIIFYGGYQVIKGKMTLGSFSAVTIYLSQIFGLQNSMMQFFQQAILGNVSCERLDKVFSAVCDFKEERQPLDIIFLKGGIQFKEITFGYAEDKNVLCDLSFEISGGSCVGLVGRSGCGKTTIINLILRLYQPVRGEVFIEGSNISGINPKIFYEQIGIVLQEPLLWNDTILNNIRYGRQESSFEDVLEASKIACLDDFINSLPRKYDTLIGENACRISEGQKQRIALARAIIKNPKILILDEAMSSLDSVSEDEILSNIKNHFKSSTIIVVSHRLSSVQKMDLVYFLKNPSHMEIGIHEELLERSASYKEFFAGQIKKIHSGEGVFKEGC